MNTIAQLTPITILRSLFWLRCIAVTGQSAAVVFAHQALGVDLPLLPVALCIGSLLAWNAIVWWRLRQTWIATHIEVFLNLAVDTFALTGLLYLSGGATNPFVSLYLVPVAIGAAGLPTRYVWSILAMCAGFYSFLMLQYTEMPAAHRHMETDFNTHVVGMWVNFLLSALLVAVFVAAIATAVRQRDLSLSRAREKALNDEKIVALGTLASGVAHEISTPLSTMTVLVDEMLSEERDKSASREDLEMLRDQISICRKGIATLLDSAGHSRSESARALPLRQFIADSLQQWQTIRPEISLTTHFEQPFEDPQVLAEQTIAQSIINLLNNAADASLENGGNRVELHLSSQQRQVRIQIDDEGKGITPKQAEQSGSAFVSTKEGGFGIGLVLSNATLARFGGEVSLSRLARGGTRTDILLPLERLLIS